MAKEQPGQVTEPVVTPAQNIATVESAASFLDNNQLNNEVETAVPIVEPTTPVISTETKEPIPVTKVEEPIKTSEIPPVSEPASPLVLEKYEIDLGTSKVEVSQQTYKYVDALHKQLDDTNSKLVALAEYEKDPYAFYAKNTPALMLEKFNTAEFVAGKLKEKFGEHVFDATKAYTPGSIDYEYRRAIEGFEEQADDYVATAKNATEQQKSVRETALNDAKTRVMTKYNLTDERYKLLIGDWLDVHKQEDVLDLIAESLLIKANATEYTANIQKNIERASQTPTPAQVLAGQGAAPVDENLTKMASVMGNDVFSHNSK